MKKHLRKLNGTHLAQLAYELSLPTRNMTKQQLVDSIALWFNTYNLRWADALSRWPWLGGAK